MQRAWQHPTPQTCAFSRIQTSRRVAKDIKVWSNSLFNDTKLQFHMASETILWLDVAMEKRQLTPAEFNLGKMLKLRVLGLAAIERARRCQASRITWFKAGNANTAYFNAKINSRKKKNFIITLTTNSRVATEHEEKVDLIHEHFNSILGSSEARRCTINWQELQLPIVDAEGLDALFREEEIWAAVIVSPAEKAPGPDGFNG